MKFILYLVLLTFPILSSAETYTQSLHCLTEAIYKESRGEPLEGQRAVAQVIMNRVQSKKFPDSVCKVLHQPGQFSYYTPGKAFKVPTRHSDAIEYRAYLLAKKIAVEALNQSDKSFEKGSLKGLTGKLFFCTVQTYRSRPHKAKSAVKVGQHVFY